VETLEVLRPLTELSPIPPFSKRPSPRLPPRPELTSIPENKAEFPNAVEDTPKKPSGDAHAIAALRSATDTPVPPNPKTPTRAPDAQSIFVLPPRLNTMHGEDTDSKGLSHMAPGTPDFALTSPSGGLSNLGISGLRDIERVPDIVGDEPTNVEDSAL
jgi:hypothetical protein